MGRCTKIKLGWEKGTITIINVTEFQAVTKNGSLILKWVLPDIEIKID